MNVRTTHRDGSATPCGDDFVLVAGEASGDQLGAELIARLRALLPAARFSGVGGPRMAAAGMTIWHPAERLSVLGLVEVLRRVPRLLAMRRDICRRTLQQRPVMFIGIDAPDFNLGLERRLRHAGVTTVHYVSPSVWAWRERRVARIGASADRVLCLFPMEPAIYARYGVDARFVGHPLAARFPMEPDQSAARAALGLPSDVPVLALLPGSRIAEIERLAGDFLAAAARLVQRIPRLRIVVPPADVACRAAFAARVHEAEPRVIERLQLLPVESAPAAESLAQSHHAMIAADAVLLASGTAALEAMLAKRPMVVAYRLARTTYRLIKTLRLVRSEVYALPNILAGRMLVPERMQDACTAEALAEDLLPYLVNRSAPPELLAEFHRQHARLRAPPDSDAAAAVLELFRQRRPALHQ